MVDNRFITQIVPNERMLKSGITTEIIPILVKANQLVNNWK